MPSLLNPPEQSPAPSQHNIVITRRLQHIVASHGGIEDTVNRMRIARGVTIFRPLQNLSTGRPTKCYL